MVTGVGYAVLAARRNRLCWISGAVSSACAALVAGLSALPMQAGDPRHAGVSVTYNFR